MAYPDQLVMHPLARPPAASIRVPGSKSITNRALILAALAAYPRPVLLHGALRSEDTEVMIDCLSALGYEVATEWDSCRVRVTRPVPDVIPARGADLFVANSGTTMRFLTAVVALGQGRFRLRGVPRMHERPIADLLAALRQLGVNAWSEQGTDCPPVIVEAGGLAGGTVRVRGEVSSQFVSGLLLAATLASGEVRIVIEGGLVSRPYVAMTVAMLRAFQAQVVEEADAATFLVPGGQTLRAPPGGYAIEPDASAASYFFAAAAITGGRVTVQGLNASSLQGDVRFVDLLERMGCAVEWGENGVTVVGSGRLTGISADMNAISDTVMTLAAVACFAEGPTTIHNVAHVRHKETDRLAALALELRKLGVRVEENPDGLVLWPAPLRGAVLSTYNDHRMAMSLALVGLRVPGVTIDRPACVAKTYPDYFNDLDQLRS